MESLLHPELLGHVGQHRAAFAASKPFRFVHIENFLHDDFLQRLRDSFPHATDRGSLVNDAGRTNATKYVNQKIRKLGDAYVEWDRLIASPEFISWVEQVSGIDGLLYDSTYRGAGIHENFPAPRQRVHIDYNYLPGTRLHRRLNLILFIHPEWDPEWGGALRMLDDGFSYAANEQRLACMPNSCVLFETNEHSWHGVQGIDFPEGVEASRMSLTVYYYSHDRPADELAPDHSTIYTPGPIISAEAQQLVKQNRELRAYVRASSELLEEAQRDLYRQSEELTRLRAARPGEAVRTRLGRAKRRVRELIDERSS